MLKAHLVGKILSFGLCIPCSSPDDSMMHPINVTIARLARAATMAIIPIQIVGNSFTLMTCDSVCIVMFGPA